MINKTEKDELNFLKDWSKQNEDFFNNTLTARLFNAIADWERLFGSACECTEQRKTD